MIRFVARLLLAVLSPKKREALAAKYKLAEEKVQELSEWDPTQNNAYLDWVCRWFSMGQVNEDIAETLKKFHRFKDNPEFTQSKNVFDYTPESLNALFAKKLRHQLSDMTLGTLEKTIKDKGLPGARLILNDGTWKIWKVQNPEYAIILSSGTSWCTTQPGNAKSYCSRGALFPIYKNDRPFAQGFLDTYGSLEFRTAQNHNFELTTPDFIELMKAAKHIPQIDLFVNSVLGQAQVIPDEMAEIVREIIIEKDDYILLKSYLKKIYWDDGWELMFDINSKSDITKLINELSPDNPFFQSPHAEEALGYLTFVGPGFLSAFVKSGRLSEFFEKVVGKVELKNSPSAGAVRGWLKKLVASGDREMMDKLLAKIEFEPEDCQTVLQDYWVKYGEGKPLKKIHGDMMRYCEPYADYFNNRPLMPLDPALRIARGDIVVMQYQGATLVYQHQGSFLNRRNDNAKIFELLGVVPHEFCTEAYGYSPQGGDWPEWRGRNPESLQRVLQKLQEAGVSIIVNPPEGQYEDDEGPVAQGHDDDDADDDEE